MQEVLPSALTRLRRRLKCWWLYKLDVLAHGDIRPSVFWFGLSLFAWGLIVLVAPQASRNHFEFFYTYFPDLQGGFAIVAGVFLLSRKSENGITFFAATLAFCGWIWAFVTHLVDLGLNASGILYLILIFRAWWLVYRTAPSGERRHE